MSDVQTDPNPLPTEQEPTVGALARRGIDVLRQAFDGVQAWLLCDQRSLYGASLARILSGGAVLGLLVTNIRQRDLLFGPASVWNAEAQQNGLYWPPNLVDGMGSGAFLVFYLGVIVVAALWMLGWHAKVVGPLMLLGHIAIIERNPTIGDQGDNILRVGLFIVMFMNVTEFWSLDARRRRRGDADDSPPKNRQNRGVRAIVRDGYLSRPVLPRWLANGIHNAALATLAFQVILVYFWAGMAKAWGDLWQHGTALYYPLQLSEFRPFPLLSDLFTHVGLVVGVSTYVAMFVQLGFGLALLHPVARRVAIFFAIMLHLSIAVLMALPWFSLSMLSFDAIFVSATTYVALERWLRHRGRILLGGGRLRDASAR